MIEKSEDYEDEFAMNPWRDTGQSPISWLADNFPRFRYDRQHIVYSAVEFRSSALNGSGVYFLILDGEIIYVGRSFSVLERLEQHKTAGKYFTHYWLINGIPAMLVDHVEAIYIHAFEPVMNNKYPPVRYHELQNSLLEFRELISQKRYVNASRACPSS